MVIFSQSYNHFWLQHPHGSTWNNVADRYESFIAVFKVAGLEANAVDLNSDNLQKVTELEIRNEDEEDEIIYR